MKNHNFEETISLWDDNLHKNIILTNQESGKKYPFILKHRFVVGRLAPPSDLKITDTDQYISSKHVCFENREGNIYVTDLHSKNGTRLNGKSLSAKTRICQGDLLRIGRSEFKITIR